MKNRTKLVTEQTEYKKITGEKKGESGCLKEEFYEKSK